MSNLTSTINTNLVMVKSERNCKTLAFIVACILYHLMFEGNFHYLENFKGYLINV